MLPENAKTPSPLEGVSIGRYQGATYPQEQVIPVAITRTRLIANNPNRFFWIAINEGVNDVRLGNDPNIGASTGWLLPAGGGVISQWWEEDGESVGYEVFAIAVGAPVNVRVREVIRS